ncbi:hypothetical protein CPB85DRAFT_1293856, partial [Mucidula mucida]
MNAGHAEVFQTQCPRRVLSSHEWRFLISALSSFHILNAYRHHTILWLCVLNLFQALHI